MIRGRRPLAALAVLAAGAAACGTILGDVPDGRLSDARDGGTSGSGELDGTICSTSNASIIDMAVDDTHVYWLSAGQSGGARTFALEKCKKDGGEPQTIATMNVEPKALVLSKDHALWSVDRKPNEGGGVWRMPKEGGSPPSAPWAPLDHAGALAFAADTGRLFVGMPAGNIEIYLPDTDGGLWGRLIAPYPPPGPIPSIFVSDTTVYWSRKERNDIVTVPSQPDNVGPPDPFAEGYPSAPSFLWSDNGALYWAVVSPAGASIYTQRTANSKATFVTGASAGFAALAVRNGIYWADNGGGLGVVRHCAANAACSSDKPFWQGNARVSHLAVDDTDVYFDAGVGTDTHIVKRKKPS